MKNLGRISLFLVFSASAVSCTNVVSYENPQTLAMLIIGIIWTLFILLARYSNMIRDEVSDMAAFNANAQQLQKTHRWIQIDKNAPFSLTKVQFGLWTVIISSSYIYLSLFKGDCATAPINKTALVLMGICSGTAVASTFMDKTEIGDNRDRHQNTPSQGFFIDILSDENGISLHRFQNFAWTIIAITVYVYKISLVKTGCDLPELSDTLLALTGISSITYLTLKSKENDPPLPNTQLDTQPIAADPAPEATNGVVTAPVQLTS